MSKGIVQVIAAGVLVDEDRVFIQQRTGPPMIAGKWEFPGGKIQYGEGPRRALLRELREELGAEVKILNLLHVTASTFENHNILIFWTCKMLSPPGESRYKGAWVTLDDMKNYDILPGVDNIAHMALEMEKSKW